MQSLIQQLQNNESILLMYLAGELGSEDRVEVEQMLERDPAMKAELQELRQAQALANDVLARLDAADPIAADSVSVRKISRHMRQWQVDRAEALANQQPERKLKYAWWIYPAVSVAAASILFAFLMWWQKPAPQTLTLEEQQRQFMFEREQRIGNMFSFAYVTPSDEQVAALPDTDETAEQMAALTEVSSNPGGFWVSENQ